MGNYHVPLKMLNDCEIVKWIGGDMIDIKEEIECLKSNMTPNKFFSLDPSNQSDEEMLASRGIFAYWKRHGTLSFWLEPT